MKDFAHIVSLTKDVQKVQVETDSIECATAILSNSYNPVRLRPIAGTEFHLKADAIIAGGVGITTASTRSGIQYDFENPYNGYGLTVPVSGNFSFEMRERQHVATDGQRSLLVDSSQVTQALFSGEGMWRRIAISTAEMHAGLHELTGFPIRGRIEFCTSIEKNASALKILMMLSEALFVGFENDAPLKRSRAALTNVRDSIITVLLESVNHNYSEFLHNQVAAPAPRQVRRAEEFIHANARQSIQLNDIAAAANVSSRSLQMAFKQFRNMSPMTYLRKVRLQGVHSELLSCTPETKIAEVAYGWGFAHMGLFAAQFREMFNETPSATLRRNLSS
jgi:AraC-like DNA-binding protein